MKNKWKNHLKIIQLDELDSYWNEAKKVGLLEGDVNMSLDKFLKVSRLIKRRTLAKEVSDQGRISG